MPSTHLELFAQLAPCLSEPARSWLGERLSEREKLLSSAQFRVTFAQAARKLGSVQRSSGQADEPVDLARIALLLAALEQLPESEHEARVSDVYRSGEQREQRAVLRALPHLPRPERFTELAVDACRTNSMLVFAAIAAENPFPSRYFPELHFNQLVLKAIFLGLAVGRIDGLAARLNDELARMLREYASERRAAGREVPSDVAATLALYER